MSNSFTSRLWEPGGILRQKQRSDFESTFLEYQEFVKEYNRFPTQYNDGTTNRGTSLYSWRAKIRCNKRTPAEFRDRLLKYEEDTTPIIQNHVKKDRSEKLYQKFLDEFAGSYDVHLWYPKSFEEYLEGDNRFKYFTIRFYMETMKHLDEPVIDCLNEIRLLCAIFNESNWAFIYYEVGMENLVEKLNNALDAIKYNRGREILKLRFGINESRIPMTLKESKPIIGVTRERIRQIENKALRELRQFHRKRLLKMYDITNEMRDEARRNKIGHWFILYVNGIKDDVVISLPVEELEEALSLHGFDIDEPLQGYHIESVSTEVEHELFLGGAFLRKLGLELSGTNRAIEYTTIRLGYNPPFDTISYLEKMEKRRVEEEARSAKLEEIMRKKWEELERKIREQCKREQEEQERIRRLNAIRKGVQEVAPVPPREYERLKAHWRHEVRMMIKYIRYDDVNWIEQINELIKVYQISADLLTMAQEVLFREIEFWGGKTEGFEFIVQCINLGLNADDDYEFMYRIQLKRK